MALSSNSLHSLREPCILKREDKLLKHYLMIDITRQPVTLHHMEWKSSWIPLDIHKERSPHFPFMCDEDNTNVLFEEDSLPLDLLQKDDESFQELLRENRRLKYGRLCKFCLAAEYCLLFRPCGHLSMCVEGGRMLPKPICPICNKEIVETLE